MRAKKAFKKIFSITICTVIMLVSVYSSSPFIDEAYGAEVTTSSGLIFETDFNMIIGYEGTSGIVDIPSTINGVDVLGIWWLAFAENTTITQVTIPDSVVYIGVGAFFECDNLSSVTIGSGVEEIEDAAFAGCENLETITLNGTNAYYRVEDNVLYSHDGVDIIQLIQFPCADTKTTFTIPETVTSIGIYSFYRANNLTEVTIHDAVLEIGEGAFCRSESLESFIVGDDNPNYTTINDVLYSKDGSILVQYPCNRSDPSYPVPTGVTTIREGAFANSQNLTSVDISATVTDIGIAAFSSCKDLDSINVDASNANYKSVDGVVLSKDGAELTHYPSGNAQTSYTMPEGVTSIEDYAFDGSSNLESIEVCDGVTSIGSYSFGECSNLEKIIIPASVLSIESDAFIYSDNVVIWGYANTEAETFAYEMDIPFALIGDTGDFTYTDNADGTCTITGYIGTDVNVVVPSVLDNLWVETVGAGTFHGCITIEAIMFSEFIETLEINSATITENQFKDCALLEGIYFPASLATIENDNGTGGIFAGCTLLSEIIVSKDNNNFYDISSVLFDSSHKLMWYPQGRTNTAYTMPATTTDVDDYTFLESSNLQRIGLSVGLEPITVAAGYTFGGNINEVHIPVGVLSVENVFTDTIPMKLYFPNTVTTFIGFAVAAAPIMPHTFYVYDGSAAHIYAVDNNIPYEVLYTFTFDSNGGTVVEPQIVQNGTIATEPTGVIKTNNVLLGWCNEVGLTTFWNFNTDVVTDNKTVYAAWVEGYNIIYYLNGGINDEDNLDYYIAGTEVVLQAAVKEGYDFVGWYSDSSCTVDYFVSVIEIDERGDVELWARWEEIIIPGTGLGAPSSGGSGVAPSTPLPEYYFDDFPENVALMQSDQEVRVKGKIRVKHETIDKITYSYGGKTVVEYEYSSGSKKNKFTFDVTISAGTINYKSREEFRVTVVSSDGKYQNFKIPIEKYILKTEVLNAPDYNIYFDNTVFYELRTMAISDNSFELLDVKYTNETPDICTIVEGNAIVPKEAGTAKIKATITLADKSQLKISTEINVIKDEVAVSHFSQREFMCHCYGKYCTGLPEGGIDEDLIKLLEEIRAVNEVPIYIVCGYRCPEYNDDIGADEGSEHVLGTAADIMAKIISVEDLYAICDEINIEGGVGKYPLFTHVDTRGVYVRWDEEE